MIWLTLFLSIVSLCMSLHVLKQLKQISLTPGPSGEPGPVVKLGLKEKPVPRRARREGRHRSAGGDRPKRIRGSSRPPGA